MFPIKISKAAPTKAVMSEPIKLPPTAIRKTPKIKPPTNEPTTPKIRFSTSPNPFPFITFPAKYPAATPIKIKRMNFISLFL